MNNNKHTNCHYYTEGGSKMCCNEPDNKEQKCACQTCEVHMGEKLGLKQTAICGNCGVEMDIVKDKEGNINEATFNMNQPPSWQEVLTEIWEKNRSNSEDVFTLPEAIAELEKVINTKQNKQILEAYHDKEENRKIGANMERERIMEIIKPCLDYCKEQNGRSDCKNCGLSMELFNPPEDTDEEI